MEFVALGKVLCNASAGWLGQPGLWGGDQGRRVFAPGALAVHMCARYMLPTCPPTPAPRHSSIYFNPEGGKPGILGKRVDIDAAEFPQARVLLRCAVSNEGGMSEHVGDGTAPLPQGVAGRNRTARAPPSRCLLVSPGLVRRAAWQGLQGAHLHLFYQQVRGECTAQKAQQRA